MTREKMKKLLPIIQAWVDGKTIQVWTNDTWVDEEYPCFFEELSQFRIKPEPKYRPFRTQEECWEEMHKHPDFGWLYYKKNKYYVNIGVMGDYSGMNGQKFADAFNSYTFTDGEPFGIKEE